MRVLHACSRYWPGVGGGENYLRGLSERLAAEGHGVTVATTDADETELFWDPTRRRLPEAAAVHEGVHIRRFPLRHLPLAPRSYSVLRYLLLPALSALPVVPTGLLARLARLTPWSPAYWQWAETTSERFDVVGAMGILYEPFVAAAARMAHRCGAPLVVFPLTHLGAGPAPGRDGVSRYYTMRHQVALVRAAAAVVVMTETEADFYRARGVPPERLVVAPPGIDLTPAHTGLAERFRARHGVRGPLVVFLSAMARDKGAVQVVEAARQLWAAGQPVELVMAGKVLAEFERYLAGLPAADRARVRVLGPIPEAEKHDLLAAAEVVVMPSRTDSFGIIYQEAWLYGKPVIGARAWGMADVIRHDEDGLLVPFGDAPALAEALGGLLDDPVRGARLGANGAAKVRAQGGWEHRYGQIRELYQRLAVGRR